MSCRAPCYMEVQSMMCRSFEGLELSLATVSRTRRGPCRCWVEADSPGRWGVDPKHPREEGWEIHFEKN